MNFQITDTKPMDKNTLKGLFSLVIGPIKIEGFSYHVKEDKAGILTQRISRVLRWV